MGIFRLTHQPCCGRDGLWLHTKESRHESRSSIDTASARSRQSRVGLASEKGDRWVERVLSFRQTRRIRGRPTFPLIVEKALTIRRFSTIISQVRCFPCPI
jgi:hypothetical protein